MNNGILTDEERYDLQVSLIPIAKEINMSINLNVESKIVRGMVGNEEIVPCVKVQWVVNDKVEPMCVSIIKNFMLGYIKEYGLGLHYLMLERDVWYDEVRYNLIYVEEI